MTFLIGTPHTRGAGYYNNDDRASGGKLAEADIRTCPHCQAIIKMQEWDVLAHRGGWCQRCFAPVCAYCGEQMKLFGCTPFMAQLEKQLESGYRYSQYLKDAGLAPPGPPQQPIFTG
jgi:hypothetical protein